MKVGFVGLGKLGLPCALAMADKGHEVYGYDVSDGVLGAIQKRQLPYQEEHAQELLNQSSLTILSNVTEIVQNADLIFVPIQTPHQPEYEGITPIPDTREDFNYDHLVAGVRSIVNQSAIQKKHVTVVVISTVLPGTIDKLINPLLNEYVHLCYNPYFIAMGTTINDFLNPEFVLLGCDDDHIAAEVEKFYSTIHSRPVFRTSIATAELTKVAYNTFIGMKIVFINAMMEICFKTGADVDDLSSALSLATERIISDKYMRGGMGDGGGCHPRDNIALSWLSKKLNLSHDIFEDLMLAREDQTKFIAEVAERFGHREGGIVILGKAYKPETNLTVGSPALLLKYYLPSAQIFDPYIDLFKEGKLGDFHPNTCWVIATKHECFRDWIFPIGAIVIDPWGYIPDAEGVFVMRLGRNR